MGVGGGAGSQGLFKPEGSLHWAGWRPLQGGADGLRIGFKRVRERFKGGSNLRTKCRLRPFLQPRLCGTARSSATAAFLWLPQPRSRSPKARARAPHAERCIRASAGLRLQGQPLRRAATRRRSTPGVRSAAAGSARAWGPCSSAGRGDAGGGTAVGVVGLPPSPLSSPARAACGAAATPSQALVTSSVLYLRTQRRRFSRVPF